MTRLELLYTAIDSLTALGKPVDKDLYDQLEQEENKYIENTIFPEIDKLEPLLTDSIKRDFYLVLAYNKEEGIKKSVLRKKDLLSVVQQDTDNTYVEQTKNSQVYFYVHYGEYFFEVSSSPIEETSGNNGTPIIRNWNTISMSEDWIVFLYENGAVGKLHVKSLEPIEISKKNSIPNNQHFGLVHLLFCKHEDRIVIYSKDSTGKIWLQVIPVGRSISYAQEDRHIVPDGHIILFTAVIKEHKYSDLDKLPLKKFWNVVPIDESCKDVCHWIEDNLFGEGTAPELRFDTIMGPVQNTNTATGHQQTPPSYYIRDFETKAFYVTFEDGTKCVGSNASITMVMTINEMLKRTTIQELSAVDISVDTLPLLSPTYQNYGRSSFNKLANGWWVNTHMNNATKKEMIERLAQATGIKLIVHLNMAKKL